MFAWDDFENYGISEVAIFLFPDVSNLRRVKHPVLNEANQRRPCHRVSLEYCLTMPEAYDGPWSAQMAVAEGDGDGPDDDFPHSAIVWECGISRFGLFGHLQAASGGDPTPDANWQRLLCVPGGEDRFV